MVELPLVEMSCGAQVNCCPQVLPKRLIHKENKYSLLLWFVKFGGGSYTAVEELRLSTDLCKWAVLWMEECPSEIHGQEHQDKIKLRKHYAE